MNGEKKKKVFLAEDGRSMTSNKALAYLNNRDQMVVENFKLLMKMGLKETCSDSEEALKAPKEIVPMKTELNNGEPSCKFDSREEMKVDTNSGAKNVTNIPEKELKQENKENKVDLKVTADHATQSGNEENLEEEKENVKMSVGNGDQATGNS